MIIDKPPSYSPSHEQPMSALEYKMEMKRVMELVASGGIQNLNQDEMRILKHCCDSGYIEGVKTLEMCSGRVVAEIRFDPVLTLAGREFRDALNAEHDESDKPSEAHPSIGQGNTGNQTSKWEKISVISSIIIGIVSIAVTVLLSVLR